MGCVPPNDVGDSGERKRRCKSKKVTKSESQKGRKQKVHGTWDLIKKNTTNSHVHHGNILAPPPQGLAASRTNQVVPLLTAYRLSNIVLTASLIRSRTGSVIIYACYIAY